MNSSDAISKTDHSSLASQTLLHVIHGVQSLDVGGLERIVLDLASVGRRRGHKVSVVCLEKPGTLAAQVEAVGATVVCLDKPPGLTAWLRERAATILTQLAPDILHTHTVGALWYLGPVAQMSCRIPVLHTEHIDNVGKATGWWTKLKTRVLWHKAGRFADRFCCVSNDVARSALRWWTVPSSKVETVLNGIDTDRYTDRNMRSQIRASFGIAEGAKVVGTVGRLNEVKSQNLLLRAVAELGTDHGNVHILLVGDGPERASLERLASELGLASRTHFAGYQQNPEHFLSAMDAFALTSRIEGLPLALLEAWAAGIPVVSSAVGGVPKVVVDGESGFLFPNGDVPALTKALVKLLTDRNAATKMAAAGLARVREQYSLERMATDYEKRYRSLIATRGGRR
jgi:glycosyltransferase involved in cell wall biosynthesis